MLTVEWRKAIEGYLAHERAGGKRTSTSSARRQHLEHLARRVNVGPWQVTADILSDGVSLFVVAHMVGIG